MRAVSVDADAVVVTSAIWRTTATAIRSGQEAFLIDSPYLPEELEALPALLEQTGFTPDALLATHADFDHLLGRLAFPQLALGVGEPTALRLHGNPGAAQRELRDSDADFYIERERPLSLGSYETLPVPGKVDFGGSELELHPAPGHTEDGVAILWRERGILVAGDYLSDVEIPTVSDLEDYRSTLARLGTLIADAQIVIPGHGSAHGRETALRLLGEDVDYLDALERGDARLPKGRQSARQRALHERNLSAI